MGKIVWTRSEDGWILDGMAFDSPTGARGVLIGLHGVGRQFYDPLLVALTQRLAAERRYHAVSVNLRGHDYGALLSDGNGRTRLQGGAWEDLRESPFDVGGWVKWAENAWPGLPITLVGHSLGGWKAAHFQAQRHHPGVERLVLVSPVFYPASDWWSPEAAAVAEQMVAEGRGDILMPDVHSRLGPASATMLLSRSPKFWPLKLDGLLAACNIPTLVTYGTVRDTGDADTLARFGPTISGRIVDGANHNYTRHLDPLIARVGEWLSSE